MKFTRGIRISTGCLIFIICSSLADAHQNRENQEGIGHDLLWKARAFQAVGRMDSLLKLMKNNETLPLRLEYLIESAYALFAIDNPPIRKIDTEKTTTYHMLFNLSLEKSGEKMTDLAFIYDDRTGNLAGFKIDSLEKGISVTTLIDAPGIIVLSSPLEADFPMIFIQLKNPFRIRLQDLKSKTQ